MRVEGENVGEILDELVKEIGDRFKNELFNEDMIIKSRYLLLLNGRRVEKDKTSQTQVSSDRKSTRLNSSHIPLSRMPSSA